MRTKTAVAIACLLWALPTLAEPVFIEKPDAVKKLEDRLKGEAPKETVLDAVPTKAPRMIELRFAGYARISGDYVVVFMQGKKVHMMEVGDTWQGLTLERINPGVQEIEVKTLKGVVSLRLYGRNTLRVRCQKDCTEEQE